MKDGKILEQNFKEYGGEVALLKGGGGGGTTTTEPWGGQQPYL